MEDSTVETTDDPATYRWVAGQTSAEEAARSSLRMSRAQATLYVVLWVLIVWVFSRRFESVGSQVGRLLWSTVVLSVTVVPVFAALVVLGRLKVRRQFRQRISPGDELTSRFTAHSLVLTSPRASHEHSFTDIASLKMWGDWIHVKHLGDATPSVWPAALFPVHEVARIRAAIESRSSG